MPSPLTFAIEFATGSAEQSLKGLAGVLKASTVDLATNILAPISPTNLITQVAQQGLGINSLAGNLVQGGIGMLGNSSMGYLAQMGAGFNADNQALNQTIGDARFMAAAGFNPSQETLDWTFKMNHATAQSQENIQQQVQRTIGARVAAAEVAKGLDTGSRALRDVQQRSPIAAGLADFGGSMVDGLSTAGSYWGLDRLIGQPILNLKNWIWQ